MSMPIEFQAMFWIFGVIFLIRIAIAVYNMGEEYNTKNYCRNCEIVSRKGHIELNKIKTGKDGCPHCESSKIDTSAHVQGLPTPFSPKFSWLQRVKLHKLLTRKAYDDKVDIQVQSYLKLQQKQMKDMKGDKNESI